MVIKLLLLPVTVISSHLKHWVTVTEDNYLVVEMQLSTFNGHRLIFMFPDYSVSPNSVCFKTLQLPRVPCKIQISGKKRPKFDFGKQN